MDGEEASELCYATASPACGRKHVVPEHIFNQIGVRVIFYFFFSLIKIFSS